MKKVRKGTVVVNQKDLRKHVGKRKYFEHMTSAEINGLFKRLKDIQAWTIGSYVVERIKQRGIEITHRDLVSAIHNSDLIEYKIDRNKSEGNFEERVLLSSKAIVNRYYNLKVVYSITNQRIITVWINRINDTHQTLDYSVYDKDMKVFGV